MLAQEALDRIAVEPGELLFDFRQRAGLLRAPSAASRETPAGRRASSKAQGRPPVATVGPRQGHIDAVERGAAHQADRAISRPVCARDALHVEDDHHSAFLVAAPSAASSINAPTEALDGGSPPGASGLYRLRLHRGQFACRQPGVDHAAAPVQQYGHKPIVLMGGGTTRMAILRQGRSTPAARRCRDRSATWRASARSSQSSCISAMARPTPSWSTMPTGSTNCATSRFCAISGGISRSTAC